MSDREKTSARMLDTVWTAGTGGVSYFLALARGLFEERSEVAEHLKELAQRAKRDGVPLLDGLSLNTAARIDPKLRADLGAFYFERGDFEAARDAYAEILEEDPKNVEALRGMGNSLQRLGMYGEATYYYLTALARKPRDAAVLLNLGVAFEAMEQPEQAVRQFEKALDLDPENRFAQLALGTSLRSAKDYDRSAQILRRLVERFPEDGNVHRQLGHTLEAAGQHEEAVTSFARAVEYAPDDALAHLNLAQILNVHDREHARVVSVGTRARTLFEKIGDERGEVLACWELGWAHYRLGEYPESIAASERALELEPERRPIRYNLALAQLRGGDLAAARGTYAEALEDEADVEDLGSHGIFDLRMALDEEPELKGGRKLLTKLEQRYEARVQRLKEVALARRRTPGSEPS